MQLTVRSFSTSNTCMPLLVIMPFLIYFDESMREEGSAFELLLTHKIEYRHSDQQMFWCKGGLKSETYTCGLNWDFSPCGIGGRGFYKETCSPQSKVTKH